jgi:hypothetical protein
MLKDYIAFLCFGQGTTTNTFRKMLACQKPHRAMMRRQEDGQGGRGQMAFT